LGFDWGLGFGHWDFPLILISDFQRMRLKIGQVVNMNNAVGINWLWIAFLILLLLLSVFYFYRKIWFYRDPPRRPAQRENVIIAPADGKIIYIEEVRDDKVYSKKLGEPIRLDEITKMDGRLDQPNGWLIGIYMSPLDVHFNYSPIEGMVERIVYTPAKINLSMVDLWEYLSFMLLRKAVNLFAKKFHFVNERNTILVQGKHFPVIIVEIADKFVNKISCFIQEGDFLEIGQKISFIERGSQVDLIIFKEDLQFLVKPGDQVYGGETVLVSYNL